MNLKPFCIEVTKSTAPDLAFGAAQRIFQTQFSGDQTTGSILTKKSYIPIELPNAKIRESLLEYVLHLLESKDKRIYPEDTPAAYVTDGHGYYLFFGYAKDEEKD